MSIVDLKAGLIIARVFVFLFVALAFLPFAMLTLDMRGYLKCAESSVEGGIDELFNIGWIDEQERKEAYDALYGR